MSESCASCRFYSPSAARGVCRRRPPVWTGPDDTHDEGMFAFPSVRPTSWCGEYEPVALFKQVTLSAQEREAIEFFSLNGDRTPFLGAELHSLRLDELLDRLN